MLHFKNLFPSEFNDKNSDGNKSGMYYNASINNNLRRVKGEYPKGLDIPTILLIQHKNLFIINIHLIDSQILMINKSCKSVTNNNNDKKGMKGILTTVNLISLQYCLFIIK